MIDKAQRDAIRKHVLSWPDEDEALVHELLDEIDHMEAIRDESIRNADAACAVLWRLGERTLTVGGRTLPLNEPLSAPITLPPLRFDTRLP